MNKRIKNLFLAGALALGAAGVSVSCTDYSKDIDELRDETADLSKTDAALSETVAALKKAIEAGSVITKVEETSTGFLFTLSDGKTYPVANGTNGADGKTPYIKDGYWYIGETNTNVKAAGTDGKTPVITIGADGYWYIDGTSTGVKATGENGADGKTPYIKDGYWYIGETSTGVKATGENGTNGTNGNTPYIKDGYWYIGETSTGVKAAGTDGKDGAYKYYVPDPEKGVWIEYSTENPNGKATTLSCLPSASVTADLISDGKTLTLTITDAEGNVSTTTIDLGGTVSSLVLVPQVYVEGVEGILYPALLYNAIEATDPETNESTKDSEDEVYRTILPAEDEPTYRLHEDDHSGKYSHRLAGSTSVEYHVNAKDVTLDDTFTYTFITKEVETRGTSAEEETFAAKAEFESFKDGVLKVKATFEGIENYDGNSISVVALKATNGKVTVVSDYATVYSDEYSKLVIARPAEEEEFTDLDYRSGKISEADEDAYISDKAVWADDAEVADGDCDFTVAYNKSIDLKEHVAVHYGAGSHREANILSTELIDVLGLSWEFELVQNYKLGNPVTDQADFATLNDGVLTPNDYYGVSASGRTPIVRVKLMDGENVVSVAYIKVLITSVDKVKTVELTGKVASDNTTAKTSFVLKAGEGDKIRTTVEDMNVNLYNKVGLSKDQFHAIYGGAGNSLKSADEKNVGTVKFIEVDGSAGTYVIEWTVTSTQLIAAYKAAKEAGTTLESLTYKAYVVNGNNANDKIYINLKAGVDETFRVLGGYDIPAADFGPAWSADKTVKFGFDATWDGNSAVTVGNISNLFKSGFIPADQLTQVRYYFDKTMYEEKLSDGGWRAVKKTFGEGADAVTVQFKIDSTTYYSAKNYTLYATEYNSNGAVVGSAGIVAIVNSHDRVDYFENDLAKKLLNTGEMSVLISAKAKVNTELYAAMDTDDWVPVTFAGDNCFKANIARPINVIAVTPADANKIEFTAAGTAASKIAIAKATALTKITSNKVVNGVFTITDWVGNYVAFGSNSYGLTSSDNFNFKTDEATCNLNGVVNKVSDVNISLTKEGSDLVFQSRVAIQSVTAFNIYIPVEISYAWGTINTTVTIPVKVQQ